VEIGGKRVASKPGDLQKIETRQVTRRPSSDITLQVVESTEPELNLVGKTVEEALPEVDKFLDRAFLSRLKEVRIIHGFGTGRLKSSLAEFLKNHPQVAEHYAEGGATRAVLRD
jgi:DNA mismatch repair protein MutS2